MGINRLSGRIILHPEARFDYSYAQIRKFIRMWEEGESVSRIAEYFAITKFDVFLLVSHCEMEEWIGPREGAYKGTKPHKWKRSKEKMRVDDMPTM